ncbi:MAG: SpoIIE family protein phosphatase [Eubacterium sp.]|nr:SpoIIE family protein phosphatase [Eubacterium sp.]
MKQTQYTTRKRKLATVTLIRLAIFFVSLLVLIDFTVWMMLNREVLNIYQDFSKSYTDLLAKRLQPEKVKEYLETGKKDAYYGRIQTSMQGMVDLGGLRYLYVFVPEEDGIRYIWDAQADDDSRPLGDKWLYTGDYPKDEVFEAYNKGVDQFAIYSYGDNDLAAAISPIIDKDGKVIAVVESDILMPHVRSSAVRIVFFVLLYLFGLIVITMIIFYSFVRRRIIGPLQKLNVAAIEMAENPGDHSELIVDIHTGDEIETLARSFENMDQKLREYIEENTRILMEKQRVNTELNLATKLQADSLPSKYPAFPDRNELLIYADMTPAKEVGGDFYDFFFIDYDHLAIIIADVSGKGIPAAMFMMMAKSILKSRVLSGGDPGTILQDVNNMICSNNPEMMFVTIWLGILNTKTGILSAANGGHEKPLLMHRGGQFEIVNDKHGAAVGLKKGLSFPNYEIQLEPGSKVLVYTDGVPEANDKDENQFGMDRLLQAVNSESKGDPEDILMLIDREVYLFTGDAEQFDDLTMLCFQYFGEEGYPE